MIGTKEKNETGKERRCQGKWRGRYDLKYGSCQGLTNITFLKEEEKPTVIKEKSRNVWERWDKKEAPVSEAKEERGEAIIKGELGRDADFLGPCRLSFK
jgi:hypothetical protein